MKKYLYLLDALRKGSKLAKPENLKNQSAVVALTVGLFVSMYQFLLLMGWVPASITETTATASGTIVGVLIYTGYQVYAILSTSDKVGLESKKEQKIDEDNTPNVSDSPSSGLRPSEGQDSPRKMPSVSSGARGDRVPSSYDSFMGGD